MQINKNIVLGICGGIAAYKAAVLVRYLVQMGAVVRVVMTSAARDFVTPMTLQALSGHAVRDSLVDVEAERAMGHIELARWADYILIAPASANFLAKMANGIADDLLSTIYLVAECPVFVAPAMNRSMWSHVATSTNIRRLRRRGVNIIGPETGQQACGEVGYGRMSEPDAIVRALSAYEVYGLLQGKHVVITAGPTREAIDPVRYISNNSSGKMGYALAEVAHLAGATVTLITGPTALQPPAGVTVYNVNSAHDMFTAVMTTLNNNTTDIFIATAAVADYTITQPALEKIKKHDSDMLTLQLQQTPDILATVAANSSARLVVGFAAETCNMLLYARKKMVTKGVDIMVANQVGVGLGFEQDTNQCVVLLPNEEITLPLMNKFALATRLIELFSTCN